MAKKQTTNDLFAGMKKNIEKVSLGSDIMRNEKKEPVLHDGYNPDTIYRTKDYSQFIEFPKIELRLETLPRLQYEQLERSILETGMNTPAKAMPAEEYSPEYAGQNKLLILGGHNRKKIVSSHNLEFKYVVMQGLTPEQADRIVAEEHLLNRQFADFLPSQICALLTALKYDKSVNTENLVEKINQGSGFNFEKNTIYRYLKLGKLKKELLYNWVDTKKIAMGSAYIIAKMTEPEQQILIDFLTEYNISSIGIKEGEELDTYVKSHTVSEDVLKKVFKIGLTPVIAPRKWVFNSKDLLAMQMKQEDLPKAKEIIKEALKLYYERQKELN